LENKLKNIPHNYVVIGGDWNLTLDSRPACNNIDTLNTIGIPSTNRSVWLNTICRSLNLIDPFRFLHPDKKEFTYVPFAQDSTVRSRLDFFLISEALKEKVVNCRIPNSLLSTLFDHKPVYLTFNRDNPHKNQTINDVILSDPEIDSIVCTAATDTYANHLLSDGIFDERQILHIKGQIGQLLNLQRELSNLKLQLAAKGHVEDLVDQIANIRENINALLANLPSIEILGNLRLSCDSDVFMEVLIMSIKNACLAYQHDFFKIRNVNRDRLEKKLDRLKGDFNAHSREILRTERELNRIIETGLRAEVEKRGKFERLNNEKITPYFMSLAKRPCTSGSTADITKEDGSPFASSQEQNSYIKNYYADAYKAVDHNNANISVESFLGEVAHNQNVIDSKLSAEERDELEADLRIEEFDLQSARYV
jgi:hypothetical protein